MDLGELQASLRAMSMDDIRSIVREIDAGLSTVALEIETTHAIIAAEAAIRRHKCRQEAAVAGHRASETIIGVATRDGADPGDVEVVRVARAAGQFARALVVLDDHAVFLGPLGVGFRQLDRLPFGA